MRKQAELLERASEISSDIGRSNGEWLIYPEYEIKTGKEGRYIEAKKPVLERLPKTRMNEKGEAIPPDPFEVQSILAKRRQQKMSGRGLSYRPLAKYVDLFLRFGRVADDPGLDDELDTEMNAEVVLGWAKTYGVLGLTPSKKHGTWGGDPRGGRGDTVAAFAFEAWVANAVLRLYEAATDPEGVDVASIAALAPSRYKGPITSTPGTAQRWALEQVDNNIGDRIARHSCGQFYRREADARVIEGYDFCNLLGAIYLSAMWLLIADRPGRCRNPRCPRIIAFEQPEHEPDPSVINDRSVGYRTRTDKEYCSKKCANEHYYQRVTKPLRQAVRTRRKAVRHDTS